MAKVLTGDVELKRIWELLKKTLVSGDLSSYNVAIDKQGEADTKRVPLDELIAFASLSAEFYDSVFKLISVIDGDELSFSLANLTANRIVTLLDESGTLPLLESLSTKFEGQAHGGNALHVFSASKTFDMNDGNIQEMPVSASTSIEISNLLVGTNILQLPITVGTSPVITIGTSLGTKYTNSETLVGAIGDENTITIVKFPSGSVRYTITTLIA